ncbi:UDP-N-acetyl-D-mannosamine transferase [Siminovitchia terrae]|uniref:WecB/TagA/CpsF family glycosyltransferase n=1 Tax=Siminovitchia terrae TaxID=1914933 RepID=UPI001B0235C6|nr:WecB/TagA/CpsF family glycosyltransferase [Siminovitchia terrae]GIN90671.1 UDP-N-acetyl-D-mannosamine transferase [Siminovitchia terrae]
MYKRVHLFNCYIDNLNMDETISKVNEIIIERKPVQHVVVNASKVVLMQKDKKLNEIIKSCALVNADGQSIIWASKILNRPIKERVTGIDLMIQLLKLADKKHYNIFLLGAKEEVVNKVAKKITSEYPNLNLVGYKDGYFKEDENEQVVTFINKSKPDILFVGISSPKKEYWLSENLSKLGVPFCMGVGGSFDVIAGETKRAPNWMQSIGLEWFYRLIQEPKRMWKRYLIGNLKFCLYVLKQLFIKNK